MRSPSRSHAHSAGSERAAKSTGRAASMCSTTRELGRVYCSQLPTQLRKYAAVTFAETGADMDAVYAGLGSDLSKASDVDAAAAVAAAKSSVAALHEACRKTPYDLPAFTSAFSGLLAAAPGAVVDATTFLVDGGVEDVGVEDLSTDGVDGTEDGFRRTLERRRRRRRRFVSRRVFS